MRRVAPVFNVTSSEQIGKLFKDILSLSLDTPVDLIYGKVTYRLYYSRSCNNISIFKNMKGIGDYDEFYPFEQDLTAAENFLLQEIL